MTSPVISVVLPVYNCPHYVGEAIDSVLRQTYEDYELIIIDDGSQDDTPQVLARYDDPRIRVITQTNRGLAETLNRGIALARGRYIARQDQDDVSLPDRFAKQVEFLDAHPDCAFVGTWAEIWQERIKTPRVHKHPSDNSTLKFELLLNNPFVHSSVMIRRSCLDRVGVYSIDRSRQPPEDYELWSRIARLYEVANIPEVLHAYRETKGSMSREGVSPFLNHLVTICSENIAWAAGRSSSDPQAINIAALAHHAKHRLVDKPNFAAMRDIFEMAAMHVVDTADSARFRAEADHRIRGLRQAALEMGYGNRWSHRLSKVAGRVRQALKTAVRP